MQYIIEFEQTIIDLAIQLYGDVESIKHLLDINPQLTDQDPAWEISEFLPIGSTIYYDEENINKRIIKELNGKLISNE